MFYQIFVFISPIIIIFGLVAVNIIVPIGLAVTNIQPIATVTPPAIQPNNSVVNIYNYYTNSNYSSVINATSVTSLSYFGKDMNLENSLRVKDIYSDYLYLRYPISPSNISGYTSFIFTTNSEFSRIGNELNNLKSNDSVIISSILSINNRVTVLENTSSASTNNYTIPSVFTNITVNDNLVSNGTLTVKSIQNSQDNDIDIVIRNGKSYNLLQDSNNGVYFGSYTKERIASFDSFLGDSRINVDVKFLSGEYRPTLSASNSNGTNSRILWLNSGQSVIIGNQPSLFVSGFTLAVDGNTRLVGNVAVSGDIRLQQLSSVYSNFIRSVFPGDNISILPQSGGQIVLGTTTTVDGTLTVNSVIGTSSNANIGGNINTSQGSTIYTNFINSVFNGDNINIAGNGVGRVVLGGNNINSQVDFISGGGIGPSNTYWITSRHYRPGGSQSIIMGVFYDPIQGREKPIIGARTTESFGLQDDTIWMVHTDEPINLSPPVSPSLPKLIVGQLSIDHASSYISNPPYYRLIVQNGVFVDGPLFVYGRGGIGNQVANFAGDIFVNGQINGASFPSASDAKIKKNFVPLNGTEVLNKMMKIPCLTYEYIDGIVGYEPNKTIAGVKAGDVYEQFGDTVVGKMNITKYTVENGTKKFYTEEIQSLSKDKMFAYTLVSIQELKKELDKKDLIIKTLQDAFTLMNNTLQSLLMNRNA